MVRQHQVRRVEDASAARRRIARGVRRELLGRRLAYTYELVELVPEEKLVMRTSEGPFPMETTYTWEPAGERSTRMTLRNRGEPSGFGKLVAPFVASAMRRANRKDLAKLKSALESA